MKKFNLSAIVILKKYLGTLLLVAGLTSGMQQPIKITPLYRNNLKSFLDAEKKGDFSFFRQKSDIMLARIGPLAQIILDDPQEFELLRKQVNMSEAELEQRLYNVIENAQRALDLSPAHKQSSPSPLPNTALAHSSRKSQRLPIIPSHRRTTTRRRNICYPIVYWA